MNNNREIEKEKKKIIYHKLSYKIMIKQKINKYIKKDPIYDQFV